MRQTIILFAVSTKEECSAFQRCAGRAKFLNLWYWIRKRCRFLVWVRRLGAIFVDGHCRRRWPLWLNEFVLQAESEIDKMVTTVAFDQPFTSYFSFCPQQWYEMHSGQDNNSLTFHFGLFNSLQSLSQKFTNFCSRHTSWQSCSQHHQIPQSRLSRERPFPHSRQMLTRLKMCPESWTKITSRSVERSRTRETRLCSMKCWKNHKLSKTI